MNQHMIAGAKAYDHGALVRGTLLAKVPGLDSFQFLANQLSTEKSEDDEDIPLGLSIRV
jgi:hypothetical protein